MVIYIYVCKCEFIHVHVSMCIHEHACKDMRVVSSVLYFHLRLTSPFNFNAAFSERWGAGVETQKNVRGEIEGWGRVPFNETYAPSLSTIYDGA